MTASKDTKSNRLQGQKRPFEPDDIRTIRSILSNQNRPRDLALFCIAIDTMLRGSDILRLRVQDLTDHQGQILTTFEFRQRKTGKAVMCGLTEPARKSLEHWITISNKMPWDFLFTSQRRNADQPITTGQYRRLVKEWAGFAALDVRHFSGHSTRRTKASIIYRKTGNAEIVRQLLGHNSITSTSQYLNISAEQAVQQGLAIKI